VARLAIVGPSWPLRGGIARTTTALAGALGGDLAAFLTPRRQYPAWLYPGHRDFDEGACPRLATADRCFAVLEPWTWPAVRRRLAAARPDAIVVPYWTWAWAPLTLRVASWRLAPLVVVVHNPADHDADLAARAAARAVLRRSSGFLCHAGSVAAHLREGFPERPVVVHPLPAQAPPAADRDSARAELGLVADTVAFLFFGLIRPYKGVDVLLDAIARLPREVPAVVLLAGEPWAGEGERLRRRLESPDIAGRVTPALRWIPEDEVGRWFGAADAAVLPYRAATGSAVAAQALGAGLPVVASAVGGLAEVVEDGVNGTLVPPGEPGALAAALLALCDSEERARLAEGARRSSRGRSWHSYAAALQQLAVAAVSRRCQPEGPRRRVWS
jgi:glycosyltransferase involved in cell wall biosynthesis